jgi:hypothetical protein
VCVCERTGEANASITTSRPLHVSHRFYSINRVPAVLISNPTLGTLSVIQANNTFVSSVHDLPSVLCSSLGEENNIAAVDGMS